MELELVAHGMTSFNVIEVVHWDGKNILGLNCIFKYGMTSIHCIEIIHLDRISDALVLEEPKLYGRGFLPCICNVIPWS